MLPKGKAVKVETKNHSVLVKLVQFVPLTPVVSYGLVLLWGSEQVCALLLAFAKLAGEQVILP